jgi:hypothetical protein
MGDVLLFKSPCGLRIVNISTMTSAVYTPVKDAGGRAHTVGHSKLLLSFNSGTPEALAERVTYEGKDADDVWAKLNAMAI